MASFLPSFGGWVANPMGLATDANGLTARVVVPATGARGLVAKVVASRTSVSGLVIGDIASIEVRSLMIECSAPAALVAELLVLMVCFKKIVSNQTPKNILLKCFTCKIFYLQKNNVCACEYIRNPFFLAWIQFLWFSIPKEELCEIFSIENIFGKTLCFLAFNYDLKMLQKKKKIMALGHMGQKIL